MNDNWIKEIKNSPKIKKYSQVSEEGYLKFILENIGPGTEKFLVDLGAGDGYNLSNTRMFIEYYGYKSILIDLNTHDTEGIHKEFITRENILGLLEKHGCPEEFSFLSIDLDGNDYDVLETVLGKYKPRLVIAEINGTIPWGVSIKQKYDPEHIRKETDHDYFGFSISAGVKLAEKMGYKAIFQNDAMNMYMVRKDLLEDPEEVIDLGFEYQSYYGHNTAKAHLWEQV